MLISRRRTIVLLAGTALAGCQTLGSSGQLLPEIQGAFAAGAVLLETGAAVIASNAVDKKGATVAAIDKAVQAMVPVFATAKADVDSGATLQQQLVDELTTSVNAVAAAIAQAKPTPAQGAAMMARRRPGFVLTLSAAIAIVEELVSLAVQYGGPVATYVKSLINGISNSSTSTVASVDAAYANFQSALAAWNAALAS